MVPNRLPLLGLTILLAVAVVERAAGGSKRGPKSGTPVVMDSTDTTLGASPTAEPVWFWFGDCRKTVMMGVEIVVEGQAVYHSSFKACRMTRTVANTENERRTRVFYFSGGHIFQDTYRTSTGEKIEGNIWQAGADPDDILLGVSFVAHNQVLLNTLHVVKPGKSTQSKLDRDIVIKTYPMKSAAG
jgi:hypothetical protein